MSYQTYSQGQPRDQRGRWSGFGHAPQDDSLDADTGDPRTWEEIEDQVGGLEKARLYAVSSGLASVANRVHRAYAAAEVDHESEPGTRTLLLDSGNSGYAPMRARLVMAGDRYGLDDCLVAGDNGETGPMLEFYDTRYPEMPGWSGRGQFVARFYTDTLDEGGWSGADASLGGGAWRVSAENMGAARLWAMEEADRRSPSDGRLIPADADALDPPF